jgi:predicted O-methyltransferase YrrM
MYKALWHFLDHGCGAAFFKHPQKLFELVEKQQSKNILEIGTGIGYSTYIMYLASPNSQIVTIEQEEDHVELAKNNLKDYGQIEVILAKAEDVLAGISDQKFDTVFYDGYAPRLFFLKQFERLLSKNGLLISANSQKKGYFQRDGSTKEEYLLGLENENIWKFEEAFGDVLVYRKING